MARETMAQMRARMKQQAANAHADEVKPDTSTAPSPTPTGATSKRRRRRSPWVNPYPDAQPFQTGFYVTEEDIELIKALRLRLRFARDWMVLKYALERLKAELDADVFAQLARKRKRTSPNHTKGSQESKDSRSSKAA
jgi:hypothetical protein